MRNPDRTYTTLYDRSVYIMNERIDYINYWFKGAQNARDPHLRRRNYEKVRSELDIFQGMMELFEATFRDYKIRLEVIEASDGRELYNYWIEAR